MWERLTDEEGREYFYNRETNVTSWTLPENEQVSQWVEYATEDGKKYYYNSISGETTWDRPAELDGAQKPDVAESELDKELAKEPVKSRLPLVDRPSEEAQRAFLDMLREHKVDSTWSFRKVMAEFINKPVYWKVGDSLTRKRLYDEYLEAQMKEGMSDHKSIVQQFESNFTDVLRDYESKGLLKHDTRWVSIKNRLIEEDNSIFKHTILSDSQISRIFFKFRARLEEEHETSVRKAKDQAIKELETYLMEMNPKIVEDNPSWEQVYSVLQKDTRFVANKHFVVLSKVDILKLYQQKIFPTLVKKLEDQIEHHRLQNMRADAKARENFSKFLATLDITAHSKFSDFFEVFENEDSFIELCGRNGSTPAELFWDIVDEKHQTLKLKKDVILAILQDLAGPEKTLESILSSKDTFTQELLASGDSRLSNIHMEGSELDTIYNELKEDLPNSKKNDTALRAHLDHFVGWLVARNDEVGVIDVKSDLVKEGETYRVNDAIDVRELVGRLAKCERYSVIRKMGNEEKLAMEVVREFGGRLGRKRRREDDGGRERKKVVLNY